MMRKETKRTVGILLCAFLLCFSGCAAKEAKLPSPGAELPGQDRLIADFYTDKSAYRPGDEVRFTLELKNETQEEFKGKIEFAWYDLTQKTELPALEAQVDAGGEKTLELSWTPPEEDYRGYLVTALARTGKETVDRRNTAVDVSSDWSRYPRYGYLCEFGDLGEEEIEAVVSRLSRYHINGLQFYDWQDEHDKPLAGTREEPAEKWQDIAKRDVYAKTVSGYIEALHARNMMAANYNLMFGAYEDYEEKGAKKEWGLYQDEHHEVQDNHPLPNWESSLYLMDPSNPEWQDYLLAREADVFAVYDFDVFHVDTLGYRGYVYDYEGEEVELSTSYGGFLQQAGERLGKRILLNPVNGYGAMDAAQSCADFLYEEVWPGSYPEYAHLKQVADTNYDLSQNQKACVIAAYLNYEVAEGEFNTNAVKLADAVLFASGAGHLELGDTGMLSSEYFPNRKLAVSEELARDLRDYYDFFTAYETVLRHPEDRREWNGSLSGYQLGKDGEPGEVWMFGSENERFCTVQLINLLSRTDAGWRDDGNTCEDPLLVRDTELSLEVGEITVKQVVLASPDIAGGTPYPLEYSLENGILKIQIPYLAYWDMILIEK